MEWESGRPYNGHEESNARLQDMRKSLQEQDDLDAGLSSPCNLVKAGNEEDNEDLEQHLPGNEEEFGRLELSQKMKDDLAFLMKIEDWKEICRNHLPGEEDRIERDNNKSYDQGYALIGLLMERGLVSTWSDIERLLDPVNKTIAKRFKEKYKNSKLARGYRFDEDESDTLTENDYLFLCQEIGHRWKRFARQVDINENLIENIINTDCNDNDRCYKIFGKLGARDGSVKCNLVKMALQDLEYQNIIGKFNSFKVGPENRV